MQRTSVYDSTASHLLSEVKHARAWLVLRWGTTLESRVLLFSFFFFRFPFFLFFLIASKEKNALMSTVQQKMAKLLAPSMLPVHSRKKKSSMIHNINESYHYVSRFSRTETKSRYDFYTNYSNRYEYTEIGYERRQQPGLPPQNDGMTRFLHSD